MWIVWEINDFLLCSIMQTWKNEFKWGIQNQVILYVHIVHSTLFNEGAAGEAGMKGWERRRARIAAFFLLLEDCFDHPPPLFDLIIFGDLEQGRSCPVYFLLLITWNSEPWSLWICMIVQEWWFDVIRNYNNHWSLVMRLMILKHMLRRRLGLGCLCKNDELMS